MYDVGSMGWREYKSGEEVGYGIGEVHDEEFGDYVLPGEYHVFFEKSSAGEIKPRMSLRVPPAYQMGGAHENVVEIIGDTLNADLKNILEEKYNELFVRKVD